MLLSASSRIPSAVQTPESLAAATEARDPFSAPLMFTQLVPLLWGLEAGAREVALSWIPIPKLILLRTLCTSLSEMGQEESAPWRMWAVWASGR